MSQVKDKLYDAVVDATVDGGYFGIYTTKSEHIDEEWVDLWMDGNDGLEGFTHREILNAAHALMKNCLIRIDKTDRPDIVELYALTPHEIATLKSRAKSNAKVRNSK